MPLDVAAGVRVAEQVSLTATARLIMTPPLCKLRLRLVQVFLRLTGRFFGASRVSLGAALARLAHAARGAGHALTRFFALQAFQSTGHALRFFLQPPFFAREPF